MSCHKQNKCKNLQEHNFSITNFLKILTDTLLVRKLRKLTKHKKWQIEAFLI